MTDPARRSELVLILCFLAIIFSVPVTQAWLEVSRGERVQFTDLFRYPPKASNLRKFERTLEEKSWFQQNLRPAMQELSFDVLGEAGAKGLRGRDNWLFFRPDVRYLLEPNRLDPPATEKYPRGLTWVQPATGVARRDSAIRAITHFRDLLRARDIELVVMPVPGKPSIYPDKVTDRMEGRYQSFRSPTLDLLAELDKQGIHTVDLFRVFGQARDRHSEGDASPSLYLAQDTHWTPRGARLAAETVAQKIRSLGLASPASRQYQSSVVRVKRWGDVLEMTQIPGLREHFGGEEVACEQVLSSTGKMLVPSPSERSGIYKTPGAAATILVMGDSFCRIYQLEEPPSLGEPSTTEHSVQHRAAARGSEPQSSKRFLPGSAGFLSLLMRELKGPVDYIVSDGGAATDVRKKLAITPEILEDKKVVLWEFVERDISLGREGWELVPLPMLLGP